MEVTEYWRSNADGVTQTMRGSVGNILQWFAGIAGAFTKLSNIFRDSPPPASDIAAESRAESAAEAASSLFASWTAWAAKAGEHAGSQKRFSERLEARGIEPLRRHDGRGFMGLRLRSAYPC